MKTLKLLCLSTLIVAAASLWVTGSPLRASDMDNRIESSARASHIFQTYLKGDDIKVDDASITAQVKVALLFHKSTSAIRTEIKTKHGQVLVQGKAHSAAEKDLVTKIAEDVNGVVGVKNEMTIEIDD